VLQKLSDPVLSTCPSCGKAAFAKQLTAAGFQLKGSGWYVTDFRGGQNAGADSKPASTTPDTAKSEPAPAAAPAASASSDSSSGTAAGCGTSCACH
jgi:predicted nucleic acid-binding Zn ribbon protein